MCDIINFMRKYESSVSHVRLINNFTSSEKEDLRETEEWRKK